MNLRRKVSQHGFFNRLLANPGTYDRAFQRVLAEHPEIADAMVKPMRSNANMWGGSSRDGHTPTRKSAPQGSGVPGPATTPPQRAAKLAQ